MVVLGYFIFRKSLWMVLGYFSINLCYSNTEPVRAMIFQETLLVNTLMIYRSTSECAPIIYKNSQKQTYSYL